MMAVDQIKLIAHAMYYRHHKNRPEPTYDYYPVEPGRYFAHDWETDDVWAYWEKKAQEFLDTYPSMEEYHIVILEGFEELTRKNLYQTELLREQVK